jgi:hypothetical protein
MCQVGGNVSCVKYANDAGANTSADTTDARTITLFIARLPLRQKLSTTARPGRPMPARLGMQQRPAGETP